MESIDKLRKYVTGGAGQGISIICEKNILKNLDNIEREVEGMRDFCEQLDDAVTKREDVTLWGVDYMPYPLDADGVPIHAGDALTDGKHTYTVTSVTFDSFAVTVCGHSETSLNSWPIDQPGKMRHHHAPTVEDVLREFAEKITDSQVPGVHPTYEEAIAATAAKLRLAEGVDE